MSDVSLTTFIAEYVAGGSSTTVAEPATQSAAELVVDTIGVMFAGAHEPCASVAARVASACGGAEQAVVVGAGLRNSVVQASLVNGTAAHALDLDDSHHPGMLHPSAVLLPAILAVGESRHISGRLTLTSLLYGLDFMAAVGNAINPGHYDIGWHPTSTLGTVAAALACAKAMSLPTDRVEAAMAIAMSESAGVRRNFGSMAKPLHAGLAASNGVLAALLAEEGCSVGDAVMEGDRGWLDLMTSPGAWKSDDVTIILDHSFALALEGLAIKRFASCGVTHPPIEAALRLREMGIDPSDIDELVLTVHPMVPQISSFMDPQSGLQAKFSLPFCIAIALLTGSASLNEFTNTWVSDADVAAVGRLVRIETDPEMGLKAHMSWGCSLVAHLSDGRELSAEIDMAKGKWAGVRLSQEEIATKFRECCASGGVRVDDAERCLKLAESVDKLDDVGTLMGAVFDAAR